MKYSYYPGCTLKNKAKDLDAYARASAKALGFEMEEIEDWQCCGGVYPLGIQIFCLILQGTSWIITVLHASCSFLVTVHLMCFSKFTYVNSSYLGCFRKVEPDLPLSTIEAGMSLLV